MDNKPSPVKYVQMMCSTAHTYGNAVAFIQKWLIDQFPKRDNGDSVFRSINVSTKLAHRQILRTPHEISKNNKPILVLRPRIDHNEDRFLKGTPLTDRLLLGKMNYSPEVLQPFFFDKRREIAIKYQLNRTVMYIDVVMLFSTYIQQQNYVNYIKNQFPINNPFDLDTCFESYLSPELMEMISDLSGVPIMTDGSVKPFLSYMNQNSIAPVTYKLQGSSNTQEFYRYYPAKLITTISDINVQDGEKNGMINDSYAVDFTIRTEFYNAGFYFLFSDKIFKNKLPSIPDDSTIIPIFTDVVLREDWDLRTGWTMYTRASARVDNGRTKLNFKSLLSKSIVTAVDHYMEKGYFIGDILDVRIREHGRNMSYKTEYQIDYENFDILFNDAKEWCTYTVMICINPENINNLISTLFNLK